MVTETAVSGLPGTTRSARWHLAQEYPARRAVARVRGILGLTQSQLAGLLGVARITIARWEGGVTNPSEEELKALAKLFAAQLKARLATSKKAARKKAGLPLKGAAFRAHVTFVERQLELIAFVLVGGGTIIMPAPQWVELLDIELHVLDGAPEAISEGRPVRSSQGLGKMLWGYDIGIALEAALRGRTYAQRVPSEQDLPAQAVIGQGRLLDEVEARLEAVVALSQMAPGVGELAELKRWQAEFLERPVREKIPAAGRRKKPKGR